MKIAPFFNKLVEIEHPGQGIADIMNSGFSNIVFDFSVYCDNYQFDNWGTDKFKYKSDTRAIANPMDLYSCCKAVIDKCADKNIQYSVAVAPYLRRETRRSDLNKLIKQLAEESIKVCGRIGCRYLVVRPLFVGISESDLWDVNKEYYLHLASLARENSVMLLLENQSRDVNGHLVRGICSDGRSAAAWVDELNAQMGEECFGFCMNVGTCNLCGQNMYDFSLALGNRIKAVILCDSDGNKENALLPFSCANMGISQTDWLSLIRGLREISFDGEMLLKMDDTMAAFPRTLRPELMRFAKSVVDYFKWQIEMEILLKKYPTRVLFGAGNMCRNYMKCYGEQYPPMYTCDNSRATWGTIFCGLEVKSPESLKELPQDCAIFICNTYYREVRQQLHDMGIKNPIEFFNDEYMPTYYFDRLENGGWK